MNATILSATLRASQTCEAQVDFKIASGYYERATAFALVYESYVRKGLCDPNPWGMRVTPYHLLPTTHTFIAVQQGQVICTVSLIGDGDLGLPMETVYSREVELIRQRGLRVGEVSCLAAQMAGREFLGIFTGMTRLMAQFARHSGMDQMLITTHPRHALFYRRHMGFQQIGPVRQYPSVRNAPAVACCLNLRTIDRDRPPCYEQYFGTAIPVEELVPRPISRREIARFRPIATYLGSECVPLLA